MIEGGKAAEGPHKMPLKSGSTAPANLLPQVAEDWQLLDDLLLHADRHPDNYMVKIDANGNIKDVALIDNGHCLSANTAVVSKMYNGPREKKPIGPVNLERLHQFIDHQATLEKILNSRLEPSAIAGLFARAKALLARGTYGNFELHEVNAFLPKKLQSTRPIQPYDNSN
jgi:hypothetical protein